MSELMHQVKFYDCESSIFHTDVVCLDRFSYDRLDNPLRNCCRFGSTAFRALCESQRVVAAPHGAVLKRNLPLCPALSGYCTFNHSNFTPRNKKANISSLNPVKEYLLIQQWKVLIYLSIKQAPFLFLSDTVPQCWSSVACSQFRKVRLCFAYALISGWLSQPVLAVVQMPSFLPTVSDCRPDFHLTAQEEVNCNHAIHAATRRQPI